MLILASGSPRRRELLSLLKEDFVIVVPMDEEKLYLEARPIETLPQEESRVKAYRVFSLYPQDEVLAADTVVVHEGKALGKPQDREDACRMLRSLSGKRHVVLTGYTYLSPTKEISRTVCSEVYFKDLSEKEIEFYVDNAKPFDKAGSYGIQDEGTPVLRVEGSFANVMGLPVEDIALHVYGRKIDPYSPKSSR